MKTKTANIAIALLITGVAWICAATNEAPKPPIYVTNLLAQTNLISVWDGITSQLMTNRSLAFTNHILPYHDTNVLVGTTHIWAELTWTRTTNWTDTGGGFTYAIPGAETWHMELGTVSSNLVACILWKGQTNCVTLESVPISYINRAYQFKTMRVYNQ